MVIRVENLRKYYGRNRGVEHVNLELKQGEILGFIGPNGAGKSTVIRVLTGLLQKSSGTVEVLGHAPSARTNKNIGYMPGELSFYKELKVFEQLRYFADVRGVKTDKMYELSERFNLDIKRRIRELSTGNNKKVGIIGAFMHKPDILILDEPTGGLDPLAQKEFFSLLLEEKARGCSVLLSSHILSEIEKVCDRVCLIKDGVTMFTDSLDNLKKDKYKRIFITPAFTDLKLPGLKLINAENNQAVYQYKGDINPLLQILSYYRLADAKIVDLDLEEIFIHYYKKGGEVGE